MKKIHLLILKAFVRPFFVTFFIVMFVLLMLFLWKYIDDLIGKGFEWYVILELLVYASATNVAMALPLSVLLSSIMTYGTLGENYELVAIKSAGISLGRALYPMIIVVIFLSVGAFFFSEYMLPKANFKFYTLLYDVRQQKSTSLIKEGVFNSSFPGYSIRVEKQDPDGLMHDVMIYERDQAAATNSVLFAKKARMFRAPGNLYLKLLLIDGIRYEEGASNGGFNPRQTLTRFRFKETEQKLDLSGFKFHRSNENDFRSNFLMLNSKQLLYSRDSVKRMYDRLLQMNFAFVTPYIKYFSMSHKSIHVKAIKVANHQILSAIPAGNQMTVLNNADIEAKTVLDQIKPKGDAFVEGNSVLRRYLVEYHKKFTLSAACLVLFLIGAPLGAIIRKGGLGLPVVISVIFFLIYYIISTIGEKSAKDGSLSPIIGTWIAIVILAPIGIFLSYKAANDSVLFDIDLYKRFFANLFKKKNAL